MSEKPDHSLYWFWGTIGVFVALLIVGLQFVPALFLTGILWVAAFGYSKHLESEKATREARAAHVAAQEMAQSELSRLGGQSIQHFEEMPRSLLTAESSLDQAERDFTEGAFAPFWGSIEKTAMQLGYFDNSVRSITSNLKRYTDVEKQCDEHVQPFPLSGKSIQAMAAGNTTNDRMKALVRKAQCNFQFASIYEQRRTNTLLVAGFQNLAQAIDGLGDRITSSIDFLGTQISDMSSSLGASLSELNSHVNQLHSLYRREAAIHAERHDKALDMLDNIQRHRMPTGFYAGIGTKPVP